ncbi:hypothetical protein SEA_SHEDLOCKHOLMES_94 [Mycobacterium phage ShedlockHolmes]|uniref:Uncharacterized protein n=1 Tax=Mycobacterium phage ShedlockHolmes TaxID=1647313 RepID=A0A0F6WF81_9CAUD|nr:hypothetical protein SEA_SHEDLOCKHOLMES_94 [Mycobacterium phage ShedlockHolmes]AKF15271.1 hypothetical protein SEA_SHEDLOCKHOLMES_94 [Mycobacterium phage ShedlockHolmes]
MNTSTATAEIKVYVVETADETRVFDDEAAAREFNRANVGSSMSTVYGDEAAALDKADAKAADEILAKLTNAWFDAYTAWESAADRLHRAANDDKTYGGYWKMSHETALDAATARAADESIVIYNREVYAAAVEAYPAAVAAKQAASDAIDAHEAARYRGWLRFFLVPGGHIHRSRGCSSLRPTTRIGWLPNLSGETEADAVAEHGAMLCTKCFPSAPVEWTIGKAAPADQCAGSGTWDYPRETARTGYCSGNYGVCSHCGERVTISSIGKMRKHKAPKA